VKPLVLAQVHPQHTTDNTSESHPAEPIRWLGTCDRSLEGYAADDEIRFSGSSGGVATHLPFIVLSGRAWRGSAYALRDPMLPI
jgi:hypothetical protein